MPYGGNVGQAGGMGVGIQTPWYSRTTDSSQGNLGTPSGGGNRVTATLPKLQGERVEPVWTSGSAGADSGFVLPIDLGGPQPPMDVGPALVGQQDVFQLLPYIPVPPGSGDDPNFGLPIGPNGLPGLGKSGGFSWGQFATGILSLLVPSLNPPQPSPINGPYQYSTQSYVDYVESCYCAGPDSITFLGGVHPPGSVQSPEETFRYSGADETQHFSTFDIRSMAATSSPRPQWPTA